MRVPDRQKGIGALPGFTLVEIAIVLAIGGIILAPLAGIFWQLQWLPRQQRALLQVDQSVRQIGRWVSEDGRRAQTFTPGTEPDYGTFSWTDFSVSPPASFSVRYYWSDGAIFRESDDGDGPIRNQVAANITQYSDATFQKVGKEVQVLATSTSDLARELLSKDADIRVEPRPSLPVPAPRLPDQFSEWPFDVPENYVFDATKIEITGGNAQLKALGAEITLYSTDNPTIQPIAALSVSFDSISEFFELATKNGGEVKYILSNDGGTTWLWWDGLSWVASDETYAQANAAAEVNSNIAAFTAGTVLFRAFATSDGAQRVQLSLVRITYLPP